MALRHRARTDEKERLEQFRECIMRPWTMAPWDHLECSPGLWGTHASELPFTQSHVLCLLRRPVMSGLSLLSSESRRSRREAQAKAERDRRDELRARRLRELEDELAREEVGKEGCLVCSASHVDASEGSVARSASYCSVRGFNSIGEMTLDGDYLPLQEARRSLLSPDPPLPPPQDDTSKDGKVGSLATGSLSRSYRHLVNHLCGPGEAHAGANCLPEGSALLQAKGGALSPHDPRTSGWRSLTTR
jgi:hypothetical protein